MESKSDLLMFIKKLFGEFGGRVDSQVDIKSVLAEKAIRLNPIAMVKARTCREFEYFLLCNSDQARLSGLLAPKPSLLLVWKKLKISPKPNAKTRRMLKKITVVRTRLSV